MSPLFWLSYIVRSLQRGGRRASFAVLCVAVGVAGVVALQIASLVVQNALTSNVRAANGGDISVTSDSAPLAPSDLGVFRRLQRQGRVTAWTTAASVHATTVGANHQLAPFEVVVVSVPGFPLGGQPTFVSPKNGNVGALMAHPGDVLVSNVLAQQLGVGEGSRLFVHGVGGSGLHVIVRGVLAQTSFEHSAVMTVQRRDASALTSRALSYSQVFVNVPGPPGPIASLLRKAFPSGTVQTVTEALQADKAQVHDFQQFLLLVGLLALLIAGIGTLNAMQSMLVRRRLEIAMLKAMGFGQATLYALFGGEAVLIGLVGGSLGTAVGAAASKVITSTLAQAMAIQVSYELDAGTLLTGVVLGIGAALVFGVLPIARAASFRPLELLREGAGVTNFSGWRRSVGLVLLVMVLFAVLAAVTLGDLVLATQMVAAAFTAFGLLTGAFSLLVTWIGKMGRPASLAVGITVLTALLAATIVAAVKLPAIAGILALGMALWAFTVILSDGQLLPLLIAARTLSRGRARTSVTLVAFLAGVLSMSLTLTVAISLRAQIDQALSGAKSNNLVAIANADSANAVARAARSLPGVTDHNVLTVVQTRPLAVNRRPLQIPMVPPGQTAGDAQEERSRLLGGISGYNLQAGDHPRGITIAAGRLLGPRDAGTNNVLVRSALLDRPNSLKIGDLISLRESGNGIVRTVHVVGFYSRNQRRGFSSFFTPPIVADRSLVSSMGGADAQLIAIFSVDPNLLTQDAATLQRELQGALVIDVGNLAAVVNQILSDLLNVLAVITALVLGSGLAVVANGVALAMLERRREIALFKAIGFGPSNVLGFVLIENALIGTLAGAVSVLVVALALALLSHFALQQAIGFDPNVAVLVLIGATTLAVLTAYVTARRSIQVRPLEALRNE